MKKILRRQAFAAVAIAGLAGCGANHGLPPTTPRKVVQGGWTVALEEITTSSSIDLESGESSRWLQIHLSIDPPEKFTDPRRKVADVYFVAATDERGRALPVTREKTEELHEDLHDGGPWYGWGIAYYVKIASLADLPYLPKRLEHVKLKVYTATAVEVVTQELQLTPMDKLMTIAPGFHFQIEQVARNTQGLILSFRYRSDYPDLGNKDPRTVPLLIERSLVDRSGNAIFGQMGSSGGSGSGACYESAGQMRLDSDKETPVRLRLVVATKVTLDALDFEFLNLPVTEDDGRRNRDGPPIR